MSARQRRIEQVRALWEGVSWAEMATYIGPNAEKYRKVWDKSQADIEKRGYPGFSWSWCWPALIPLIGIPWAVARRQRLFAGMLVAVVILANVLAIYVPSSGSSFGFMMFLVPMMAKSFYLQTGVARIGRIKANISGEHAQLDAIKAAGGCNLTAGVIAGLACCTLLGLSVLALMSGQI
jgi:hypothetical protein